MLLVALLVLGVVPSAGAATFAIIGNGDRPLRAGVPAAEADINGQPITIAVRADGVIAFGYDGRLWWVERGVLARVNAPTRGAAVDLEFAPDGSLLVGACPGLDGGVAAVF